MTQNLLRPESLKGFSPRQPNISPARRPAATALLGVGLLLAPALAALLPLAAQADGGASIVSSPLASEIAAYNARRLNLASILNSNKSSGGLSSPALTKLNFGGVGGYSLSGLAGTQATGLATRGVSLFYYNSGSGMGSGLDDLMPSTTAYGMVDHLSLLGGSAAAGAPASGASGLHGGSLSLDGQLYLSDASANPTAKAAGLVSGEAHQAYDQHLAYTGRNISLTGSIAKIGKDFSDGGAFANALASSDQATRDSANSLLNRRGQDEQTLGLSLGAAKQMGQFTFNRDDLTDKLNNKRTALQSLGYTWGDSGKTLLSFNTSSSHDLIGHTHNDIQTFGLSQAVGKLMSLQASHVTQSQGAASASTSTTDNLHLALAPEKRLGLGADLAERITRDSFGGSDQALNVNLRRTMGGLTFGVLYGDEQRKSVASQGATASLASIRTMGYSVTKQISKLFSVDTSWQMVDDSSQAKGRRRLATESTHLNFTPLKNLTLLDQYTTNNGINNRLMSANCAVPKSALAGLGFGPATFSATDTETSGINIEMNQATTQTQKLALDSTLPRRSGLVGSLLPSFLSNTTVHFEIGKARIDDFKNSSGQLSRGTAADVQGLKLGGSLSFWKASQWSYAYALQTPTSAAAAKLPDAHEFDFSAPISKLTVTVYDHDQIDQGGGNYKHGTDRHLSLGGALTSTLNLALDTGESRDYTLANPSHTHMVGIHLSGKHGALQNLDFKLQRQLESELHNGRNNQTVYGLNFNLPKTDSRRLSLNCAVTDNKYVSRPASTGKITATVGFDFAQQF